ncbi:MAG TPA: AraC family transcriptional regulator [Caulobacteraceae bacterium]|nr:AraC family transcriptional regulator [Caulobacteraceae bacterium]
MVAIVRAAALSNFVEVARELGLDPIAAVRAAGIDPRALTEPEMRLPTADVARLLERSAEASGCPTFALRMARSRQLSQFGAISLLITHQATLREGLATIIEYRNLLNESLALSLEEHGDLVILREELVVAEGGPMPQAYELAIGAIFRVCHALLGGRWRPYSVHFTHAAPADLSVHRSVFGADVEFGSEFNGIVFSAADLDRPNPTADPALAEYARTFVESLPKAPSSAGGSSVAREVSKAVYLLLPVGRASIVQVAQGVGLNPRTLQRRLAAEGEEFSLLVDRVRRDLAIRYIANPAYSLAQIARMLGYGQHSSFTRWFATAFGAPPAAWRAGHGPPRLTDTAAEARP